MPAPHPFHIMAKPTGSLCNIQCDYCYFLDKEETLGQQPATFMSDETLTHYIRGYIDAQPNDQVVFSWQGGEPTLLGIEFFEKVVALQKRFNPHNKTIHNDLQTNGILLNKQWVKFLKSHRFFVGLSVDGPRFIHDHYRHSRTGRATLEKVKTAAALLNKYRIPFATLTCVTNRSANHAAEIYQFLRDSIGSTQMQFIPIVDHNELHLSEQCLVTTQEAYSISPQGWGRFMQQIFDEWYCQDIGRIVIPAIEDSMAVLLGHPSSSCITSKECGRALAIMQDGRTYSCDHYINDSHCLGNVKNQSLADIAGSAQQRKFGEAKSNNLPSACQQCPFLSFCHGGCPKDRVSLSDSAPHTTLNEPPHNYLCTGMFMFYQHAIPKLQQLATKLYPQ
ncbi:anaerobic sulfatase maturase [Vibrio sp. E150_011]